MGHMGHRREARKPTRGGAPQGRSPNWSRGWGVAPLSPSDRRKCWKYALEAIIKWLLLYFLVHAIIVLSGNRNTCVDT